MAQLTPEEIINNAKAEASKIKDDAKTEAAKIIHDADIANADKERATRDREKEEAGKVPTPRRLSSPLSITRDETKTVRIKITKPGCFYVPFAMNSQNLAEYEVGSIHEVSVGRADGMAGKCHTIGKPKKA